MSLHSRITAIEATNIETPKLPHAERVQDISLQVNQLQSKYTRPLRETNLRNKAKMPAWSLNWSLFRGFTGTYT